jgi:UDPglucose 6-dehydrogenase
MHGCEDTVIVEKSTVPLRTAERIREIVGANAPHWKAVHVVSNPEFLAEGTAVKDAFEPDRILVGTAPEDEHSRKVMNALYACFPGHLVLHTNVWSSELAKLANNAFLSTKITQINAIASLCESSGADVTEVARAVGMDKRIGNRFLAAGIGWGGSCFGKDLRALVYLLRHYHLDEEARFYQAAHDLNYSLRRRFVHTIHDCLHSLPNKTIAVLGFAFKPDTDDIRDAPAIDIIGLLAQEGATVRVVDPGAGHKVKECYADKPYASRITVCDSIEQAAEDADAIALVTEWTVFRTIDFASLAKRMRRPGWVFDGRNIYHPQDATGARLCYYGVGRGISRPGGADGG